MKYHIAIVEDEYFVAQDLQNIITKNGHQALGTAETYKDALVLISENEPDLVLIDIRLKGDKSGLDLAGILQKKHNLPFIFITSFVDRETLEEAKKLHPIGYIVKPFNEKNIATAIEIGMANRQKEQLDLYDQIIQQDFFFVKDKRMMKKVKFEDILYFEADDNYAFIHTTQHRYIVYLSLKEIIKKLPQYFMRVHRSYIVNIRFVIGLKAQEIYVSEEQSIPIGRSYRQELLGKLNFLSPD